LAQTPQPNAPGPGEQQSAAPRAPETPREKALAQAAEQAKKDVDFANIHLQAAKLYLTGLYGLDGRPSTWDREHGVALFTHAQDALTDAQRQLAELQGFAKATWPDARDPLAKVKTSLDHVQARLRSLSVPLHPDGSGQGADQSAIRDMYKEIDSAHGDLDRAARAMGVDAKLRKP